jgi:hypothetical protein
MAFRASLPSFSGDHFTMCWMTPPPGEVSGIIRAGVHPDGYFAFPAENMEETEWGP